MKSKSSSSSSKPLSKKDINRQLSRLYEAINAASSPLDKVALVRQSKKLLTEELIPKVAKDEGNFNLIRLIFNSYSEALNSVEAESITKEDVDILAYELGKITPQNVQRCSEFGKLLSTVINSFMEKMLGYFNKSISKEKLVELTGDRLEIVEGHISNSLKNLQLIKETTSIKEDLPKNMEIIKYLVTTFQNSFGEFSILCSFNDLKTKIKLCVLIGLTDLAGELFKMNDRVKKNVACLGKLPDLQKKVEDSLCSFRKKDFQDIFKIAVSLNNIENFKKVISLFGIDLTEMKIISNVAKSGIIGSNTVAFTTQEIEGKTMISVHLGPINDSDRVTQNPIHYIIKNIDNYNDNSFIVEAVRMISKLYKGSRQNIDEILDSYGYNPIAVACYKGNKEVINELIKLGADINCLIKLPLNKTHSIQRAMLEAVSKTHEDIDFFYLTPFSAAGETSDMEFLKWLIEQGADPLKGYLVNKKNFDMLVPVNPSRKLEDIEKIEKFGCELYLLLEYCIIKNIQQQNLAEVSVDKLKAQLKSDDGASSAFDSKKIQEEKIKTSFSPKELTPHDYKILSDNIDTYFKLKKSKIKKAKEDTSVLEDKFDIALIEYLLDQEKGRSKIDDLLKDHPELQHYAIASIVKKEDDELAENIFANFPQSLNSFFELKKENIEQQQLAQSYDFLSKEGVYEISSALTNKAAIIIASELKTELEKNSDLKNKLYALLERGIKFIEASSKGQSGIKTYAKINKIKIASEDMGILLSDCYKDSSNNLLFVAKSIVSHKELERGQKQYDTEFHKIDSFDKLIDDINASFHDTDDDASNHGFLSDDGGMEAGEVLPMGEDIDLQQDHFDEGG